MLGDGEGQGGLQKLADGEGFERTTEDMFEGDKHPAFEELFGEREGDVIASACASAQEQTLTRIIEDANNGEFYSRSISIMGNGSTRGPQGVCFAESFLKPKTKNMRNAKLKDENSSWGGERWGGSWPGNIENLKEGVWLEEQQPCILRRNKRELDAQAYVGGANKATFEELQHGKYFPEIRTRNTMSGCKVPIDVNESRYEGI
jgi:hypothetical protein